MIRIWVALLALAFVSVHTLRGAGSASAGSLAEAESYTVLRISGSPDWDAVPVLPIDQVLWKEDAGIRARGQLCHDGENLYVRLSADEEDVRAEYTEPLSPVYRDSCLEFFFRPKGVPNYFNFEINPNGCLCLQFGPDRTDRIDIVRNDAASYFDIRTGRMPGGWEAVYRIPLRFIRLFYPDARFEGEWQANLYKCGDGTENPHYLSWNPIGLEKPNFHCPEFFGTIVFE